MPVVETLAVLNPEKTERGPRGCSGASPAMRDARLRAGQWEGSGH